MVGLHGAALDKPSSNFYFRQLSSRAQSEVGLQIDDSGDAIAWISRNIGRYGGDANRIYIGGHSAGGHLAALVTLRLQLLTARGVAPNSIKACFAVSAAFNLERKYADPIRAPILDLLLKDSETGAEVSPINYVLGNRIPIHVVYGSVDLPDIINDNRRMIELLEGEDCAYECHLLEGQSHFDASISCGDPEGIWVQSVRRWMSSPPTKKAGARRQSTAIQPPKTGD